MQEKSKFRRRPIAQAVESKILRACARRCALCFLLDLDLTEKEGQIAHLDGNPEHNSEDNLCYLCLRHHSLYDSKTSQHKNYTVREVKDARRDLCAAIARRARLPGSKRLPPRPAASEADRKTLEDLLQILPTSGGIDFLRENNFAGFSFDWSRLSDVQRFFHERRNGAEYEFLDPSLERSRRKLLRVMGSLLAALGQHTFVTQGTRSSVPEEWETEAPDRFERAVAEIHDGAEQVCRHYDVLVRQARKRLLS